LDTGDAQGSIGVKFKGEPGDEARRLEAGNTIVTEKLEQGVDADLKSEAAADTGASLLVGKIILCQPFEQGAPLRGREAIELAPGVLATVGKCAPANACDGRSGGMSGIRLGPMP
jgi:hypothetical protein